MRCRQCAGVGADAEIRGVPERRDAAGAGDQAQARGEQRRDQDVDRQHQCVLVAGERQQRCDRDEDARGEGVPPRRPGDQRALDRYRRRRGHRRRRTEQPGGTNEQHQRHDDEFDDERELRHRQRRAGDAHVAGGDAQCLGDADDDRGDERAGYRAQTAQYGDDERIGDHREVHAEIGRLARQRQRTRQAGEERTQREHRRVEPRLVDAERGGEHAILGRRAHEQAEARSSHQQRQRDQHDRPDREQEHVVLRDGASEPCTTPSSPATRGPSRSSGPQIASAASRTISTTPNVAVSCSSSGAAYRRFSNSTSISAPRQATAAAAMTAAVQKPNGASSNAPSAVPAENATYAPSM